MRRQHYKHVLNFLHHTVQREQHADDDWPFPSGLFLGWIESRPIHVVAALDAGSSQVFVITAYEPDLEHFESDFRTRKSK